MPSEELYNQWDKDIAEGKATNDQNMQPDILMVEIINRFRKLGIYTLFCCQGHSIEESSQALTLSDLKWEIAATNGYIVFVRETFPHELLIDIVSRKDLNPFKMVELQNTRVTVRWNYEQQQAALAELLTWR